jgi:hypothetical protein
MLQKDSSKLLPFFFFFFFLLSTLLVLGFRYNLPMTKHT